MEQLPVARHYALVCGHGDAQTQLNSFDRALLAAGIGHFNIVKVTSILPPGAQTGNFEGLPSGGIVFAALGSNSSDRNDDLISAAVAVGIPDDPHMAGVIMEGGFSKPAAEAEEAVRDMAHAALNDRSLAVKTIESVSIEWRVQRVGTVIAAVLLW